MGAGTRSRLAGASNKEKEHHFSQVANWTSWNSWWDDSADVWGNPLFRLTAQAVAYKAYPAFWFSFVGRTWLLRQSLTKADEELLCIYLFPYLFFVQKTTFLNGDFRWLPPPPPEFCLWSIVNTEMVTKIVIFPKLMCACEHIYLSCAFMYTCMSM